MNATAQAWLEQRGCSPHVVRKGTDGVITSWEQTGRELAEGWPVTKEKYLIDVDGRQLLADMIQAGLLDEHDLKRVKLADHLFQGATQPYPKCVWGEDKASQNGWSAEKNWWYWRVPAGP